ncbi:potassium-transporting ATPase subunit C, partial [Priestia megaterium]|uniref:potassium-transporting ATPase subunit C n=1 Tax=Priestia megaterium TaxID=1404 RepID=UPI0035B59296
MLSQIRAAATLLGIFTVLLGLLYPAAMTAVAGAVFPDQASGSLVARDGTTVGSALIGQPFSQAGYLHPRPSAA